MSYFVKEAPGHIRGTFLMGRTGGGGRMPGCTATPCDGSTGWWSETSSKRRAPASGTPIPR